MRASSAGPWAFRPFGVNWSAAADYRHQESGRTEVRRGEEPAELKFGATGCGDLLTAPAPVRRSCVLAPSVQHDGGATPVTGPPRPAVHPSLLVWRGPPRRGPERPARHNPA